MKIVQMGKLIFVLISLLLISCKDSIIPPLPLNPTNKDWVSLGLENELIRAIAVDPLHSNIIYAGSRYNFSTGATGKLFKSTDCGITWDTLLVDPGAAYSNIVIDPKNTNIIYTEPFGIIKSTDGGITWQDRNNGLDLDWERSVLPLTIDPTNSNILYAGTGGPFGGNLYKTNDGGLNWYPLQKDSLVDGFISVTINPKNPNIIYAGTAWRGILWRSTNGGEHWHRTGLGETNEFVYSVFIDFVNPRTVYVGISSISGCCSLWQTADEGYTWNRFNEGIPDSSFVSSFLQLSDGFNFYANVEANQQHVTGVYHRYANSNWERISPNSISGVLCAGNNVIYCGGNGISKLEIK